MPKEQKREYVSWSDAMEQARYVERGTGFTVKVSFMIGCPRGEQNLKMYYIVELVDDAGAGVALPSPVKFSFPNANSKSLAGALLGALYQLEGLATEHLVWTEPTIDTRRDALGA